MKKAEELLEKYRAGLCTPEELSLLHKWFHHLGEEEASELSAEDLIQAKLKFERNLAGSILSLPNYKLWPRFRIKSGMTGLIAAAAVAIIVLGVYFFNAPRHSDTETSSAQAAVNDIAPGKNGATLTLANGKVIQLSDAKSGVVIGYDKLAYNDGSVVGSLSASGGEPSLRAQRDQNTTNTSSYMPEGQRGGSAVAQTAKGQTYIFTLPDGTKVWLNAASSLTIPSGFSGTDARKIKLEGEAYFEVAKDKKRPFIVTSEGQEVKVLGTHFNINAYKDEPNIKTTLLEGSVEIIAGSSRAVIRPGEQGSLKSNGISVAEVNVNTVVDWKSGTFRFKNEALASILRKVSRWYDVKIIYQSDPAKMPTFSGAISRLENVSGILQMLEETSDVKFTIEGKTIKVQ